MAVLEGLTTFRAVEQVNTPPLQPPVTSSGWGARDVLADGDRMPSESASMKYGGVGGEAAGLERLLDATHVLKVGERGVVPVPSGGWGLNLIMFRGGGEHALEEADVREGRGIEDVHRRVHVQEPAQPEVGVDTLDQLRLGAEGRHAPDPTLMCLTRCR